MADTLVSNSQNNMALDYFVCLPVSIEMIEHLATKASEVICCEDRTLSQDGNLPPTPPSTPPRDARARIRSNTELPSVYDFILSLCKRSYVNVKTLMTSLVYLARLKSRLPSVAKGMPCTVHRIFLASLILAAKNLNDSSPKNKHWARYTAVPGHENFGFSLTEVNLMEKQLLYLLDWDLRVTNADLFHHLEPFLAPIRVYQAQHLEKARMARQQEYQRQQQVQQVQLQQQNKQQIHHQRSRLDLSIAAMSHSSHSSPSSLRVPASNASSRAQSRARTPTRTPSLSPPTRSSSVASQSSADTLSISSPASLIDTSVKDATASGRNKRENIHQQYDAEVGATVVHLGDIPSVAQSLTKSKTKTPLRNHYLPPPPPPAFPRSAHTYPLTSSLSEGGHLSGDIVRPVAKKLKTVAAGGSGGNGSGNGNFLSRFLGSASAACSRTASAH